MVKSRFDAIDVSLMVRDLRLKCIGLRLSNVYDMNPKTFLFKMNVPGHDSNIIILLESGIRFHTSKFDREKNQMPSGFSMKLRKHIKGKRLDDIRQFNTDRVVDFTFGSGDTAFHVILELYAAGNIILTDHEYRIMNLLRTHQYDDTVKVAVREVYPISYAAGSGSLESEIDMKEEVILLQTFLQQSTSSDRVEMEKDEEETEKEAEKGKEKEKKKGTTAPAKKVPTLKQVISWASSPYGTLSPILLEHAFVEAAIKSNLKVKEGWEGLKEDEMVNFIQAIRKVKVTLTNLKNGEITPGYILLEKSKKDSKIKKVVIEKEGEKKEESKDEDGPLYSSFNAYLFAHLCDINDTDSYLTFPSFDEACDEFFSKFEQQRASRDLDKAKALANKKVEKLKADQERRLQDLDKLMQVSKVKAMAIEESLPLVDSAIKVVSSALASGVDWNELNELVKMQQGVGNPVALIIDSMNLSKNIINLSLPYPSGAEEKVDHVREEKDDDEEKEEEEEDEDAKRRIVVDVDLSLSAYSNISRHFDSKKKGAVKVIKTMDALNETMKDALKKAAVAVSKIKNVSGPMISRRSQWFEKFDWFISSEGYIIVMGKDAQQNEQLVKKYLRRGDIYVHADAHGAASCIIRNINNDEAIPPLTILQAGNMCICRSAAWDAKMITNAFWVNADQVSKTAPTGEYLSTGSFMIRGKKNYLISGKLETGWGMLFEVDEESALRHTGERRIRGLLNEEERGGEKDVGKESHISGKSFSSDKEIEGEGDVGEERGDEEDRDGEEENGDRDENEIEEGGEEEEEELVERENVSKGKKERTKVRNVDEILIEIKKYEELENEKSTNKEKEVEKEINLEEVEKEKLYEKEKCIVNEVGKDKEKNEEENDDEEDEAEVGMGGKAKKIASARDKRLLKRALKLGITLDAMKEIAAKEEQEREVANKKKDEAEKEKVVVPVVVRGKKGKFDKMKSKYKDQSEEERLLAIAMLGSVPNTAKTNKKEKKEDVKKEEEEKKKKEDNTALSSTKEIVCFKCKQVGHYSKDCPNEKVEKEEVDEGREGVEEEIKVGEINLSKWTGKPHPDDVILFALPMCAPYEVLRDFKYKVKLIPGSLKRGKAVKQAVDFFLSSREAAAREKDVIKQVQMGELANVMLGNTKVVLPTTAINKKSQRGQKRK